MRHEFFGSIKTHEVSRGEGSIKRHEVFGSIKRHEVLGGGKRVRHEFFGSIKKHKVSRGEGSIKRHEVFGSIKRHEISLRETQKLVHQSTWGLKFCYWCTSGFIDCDNCSKSGHWGCGGEAPFRFSEHCLVLGFGYVRLGPSKFIDGDNCSKSSHWGCGGEAPARVSEQCSLLWFGYVRLGMVMYG